MITGTMMKTQVKLLPDDAKLCAWCKSVFFPDDFHIELSDEEYELLSQTTSHSTCPDCGKKVDQEIIEYKEEEIVKEKLNGWHSFLISLCATFFITVSSMAGQSASTMVAQRVDTIGTFTALQVTATWVGHRPWWEWSNPQKWPKNTVINVTVHDSDMNIIFNRKRSLRDYPELFNKCGDTLLFQDLYFIPIDKLDSASSIYVGRKRLLIEW